jgi:RNA polymerase sigma factor (sigma-70 family)
MHSVSQWIADLKEGQADSAQQLWERYSSQLVELARRRMKSVPKRVADEEDIAASIFHSLCRGAAAGRFQDVKKRDDLWWLLLAITRQKVVDHIRRETAQKRGGGFTRLEFAGNGNADSKDFGLDQLVGPGPTPEFVVMLQEQHERLLSMLRDDCLRQIAGYRIEGFTVAEIAEKLRLSVRSIERKLKLIRAAWAKELQT